MILTKPNNRKQTTDYKKEGNMKPNSRSSRCDRKNKEISNEYNVNKFKQQEQKNPRRGKEKNF